MFVISDFSSKHPRARDLHIPFNGEPGLLNAITDVPGVEVGHSTIIEGSSVRTGVTAIWPRGRYSVDPVFGGCFFLNGNGEMTGASWIEESGFVDGPILLTNTHSVGTVRDAYIRWIVENGRKPGTNVLSSERFWALPVVAETYDGCLNDINGFHVRYEHVVEALETARSGSVAEGNVGSGTGMICYQFKAGIGTASRIVRQSNLYTVGVLVQANCGKRNQLMVSGVPVGHEIQTDIPAKLDQTEENGSIIIIVGTNAPILPHQAKRLAKRASLGLARTGSVAGNGSGDIFLAFSTANSFKSTNAELVQMTMLPNNLLNSLFEAVVEATEEAIINALVAAKTMSGINGHCVTALPLKEFVAVMKRYNRLTSRL